MGVLAQWARPLFLGGYLSESSLHPNLGDVDAGGDYGLTSAEITSVQRSLADVGDLSFEAIDAACREAVVARFERSEYERD